MGEPTATGKDDLGTWGLARQRAFRALERDALLPKFWQVLLDGTLRYERPRADELRALRASAPPPALTTVLRLVGESPHGATTFREADEGRFESLISAFVPRVTTPAPLLHALALFFESFAALLSTSLLDRAADAYGRAITCWLLLRQEALYLEALSKEVAPTLSEDRRARVVEATTEELLLELEHRGVEGAADFTSPARVAFRAVDRLEAILRESMLDASIVKQLSLRARRIGDAILAASIAPVARAFEDATARGASIDERLAILSRLDRVWLWTDEHPDVESFLMEHGTPVFWERYRADFDALGRALAPFLPMIERIGRRVETDPQYFAYAAPAAQLFTFHAESLPRKQALPILERAVAFCPTHRNARLVLASLLAEEAKEIFGRPVYFVVKAELDHARHLIARIEQLWPENRSLPKLKEQLRALEARK